MNKIKTLLTTILTVLMVATPVFALTTKYVAINSINWQSLDNLQLQDGSEFTYFVLLVNADGSLYGGNDAQETKFVSDVHSAGKKATFSVGGGTQDAVAITTAVNNVTGFVTAINNRILQYGYDGVTLDIENTSIDPQKMADFINALRVALPTAIIGVDVQPYQRTTVWANLDQASNSVDWVSPLLYDAGKFKVNTAVTKMNAWLTEVPANKLLAGLAVNYPVGKGGLSPATYGQMLDVAIANGWKGVAIWNNYLYTQSWIDVARSKIVVE